MVQRRKLIRGSALMAAMMTTPGLFAEELVRTAGMTEGPFYPVGCPYTDNDLLLINDSITPGVGQITHLSGKILSPLGRPIRNAFVKSGNVITTVHTCMQVQAMPTKGIVIFRDTDAS